MSQRDLTTLANLKAYLPMVAVDADPVLSRLISAASAAIKRYVSRDIVWQAYSETRSGRGTPSMVLRQFPVTKITSLSIDGLGIPQRPALGSGSVSVSGWYGWSGGPPGWALEPDRTLWVSGYQFTRGMANVVIAYAAGFQAVEAINVPGTPFTYQATSLWRADAGVVYTATGTALVAVASAPALGQYSVTSSGLYTFNSADAGAGVTLSYGTVPEEIEQTCIELATRRFRERGRIGDASKTVSTGTAHETTVFTVADFTKSERGVLDSFKSVAMPV